MRHLLVFGLLVIPVSAFAQNPCAVPLAHQILPASGANQFWSELPDHNTTRPDGSAVTLSYQYGAWPDGVNPNTTPPTQGPTTIPKTAFVAVPGFPNCYKLTGGLPSLMPTETRMVGHLRAVGQPTASPPQSAWSTASDSFSLASSPLTPAPPGQGRIRP